MSGYPRYLAFPFRVGSDGRTLAVSSLDQHVRDEIVQLILTAHGERLYLGDFGTNLRRMVFENVDDGVLGLTRASVANALSRWLGHRVRVESLEIGFSSGTLSVNLSYQVNGGDSHSISFQRTVG